MLFYICSVLVLVIRSALFFIFVIFLFRTLHSLCSEYEDKNAELISFCNSLEEDKAKRKKARREDDDKRR